MDLSKVRKFEYRIDLFLSNEQIRMMRDRENIISTRFRDTNSMVEIYPLGYNRTLNFDVGNFKEQDGRYFYDFNATLSNGMVFEKTFWNFEMVEIMSFQELRAWKKPRMISVVLKVGVYDGDGSSTEWQAILENIDDFTSVCSPKNFHSQNMEQLLSIGYHSDVTFEFPDGRKLSAHKCVLVSSSLYFRVLLDGSFIESRNNTIEAKFDYELMKLLILFLYTGRVNKEDVSNWQDVYRIAHSHNVSLLANHAQLQLMAEAPGGMEEIKKVIKFAMKYRAYRLKEFLIKHTRKIQETKETRSYHKSLCRFDVLFI